MPLVKINNGFPYEPELRDHTAETCQHGNRWGLCRHCELTCPHGVGWPVCQSCRKSGATEARANALGGGGSNG